MLCTRRKRGRETTDADDAEPAAEPARFSGVRGGGGTAGTLAQVNAVLEKELTLLRVHCRRLSRRDAQRRIVDELRLSHETAMPHTAPDGLGQVARYIPPCSRYFSNGVATTGRHTQRHARRGGSRWQKCIYPIDVHALRDVWLGAA